MKKAYAGRLLITSISLFVCSLCHLVWKQVMGVSILIEKIGSVGADDFKVSSVSSWLQLITDNSRAASVHSLTLNMLIPLEIVCALTGCICSIARFAGKNPRKMNIIPALLGILISVTGIASFVSLVLSGKAEAMALVLMFFTLAAIPALFLAVSVKFFGER